MSAQEIFDQIISEKCKNRIISFSKKNKVNSGDSKCCTHIPLDIA